MTQPVCLDSKLRVGDYIYYRNVMMSLPGRVIGVNGDDPTIWVTFDSGKVFKFTSNSKVYNWSN